MPGALGRLTTFSKTLTVVDADLTDVDLRVSAGARVIARVIADVGSTRAFDPAAVELGILRRTEGDGRPFFVNGFGSKGSREGLFGELSVAGGSVYFEVGTPAGWMVKAIRLDGYELEDGPVDLAAGRRELDVVLTDRVSGVSGDVLDRLGRLLPNYSVVVFPADPARWHFSSRTIREERTDSDGRFRIDGLPPGNYRAVAVPALGYGTVQDSAVLERLHGASQAIRVSEGQHLAISIRASPRPDGLER